MTTISQPTTRQILTALRADSRDLFKSLKDKDNGKTIIARKPDFDVTPYDSLKDFWAFVGYAEDARIEGDEVVFA